MNGYEIEKTLASMYILVDSREHSNTRAQERYNQFGVFYEKSALSIGDYTYNAVLPSGKNLFDTTSTVKPHVAIERKMSLDEAVSCFVGKKKNQFKNELQRAKDGNCKLYLLVEDTNWADIYEHTYRSKMEPDVLLAFLIAYQVRYDMHIVFSPVEYTGKLIKEILYRELKERLQNGEITD